MNHFIIKEKDNTETKYVRDHNGVIKQLYPVPYVYDKTYVATYDNLQYEQRSLALQRLRLGFVEAMYDGPITSLLDCGYGNGAFLKHVITSTEIELVYGSDVSHVPAPPGVTEVSAKEAISLPLSVMTFWDCLEHFPDLSFVADINADMIAISLPYCHFNSLHSPTEFITEKAITWFTNWHHRKPNEHLFHFDHNSLRRTMKMYGWKCIGLSNLEDAIRKPRDHRKNILTAAFKR